MHRNIWSFLPKEAGRAGSRFLGLANSWMMDRARWQNSQPFAWERGRENWVDRQAELTTSSGLGEKEPEDSLRLTIFSVVC